MEVDFSRVTAAPFSIDELTRAWNLIDSVDFSHSSKELYRWSLARLAQLERQKIESEELVSKRRSENAQIQKCLQSSLDEARRSLAASAESLAFKSQKIDELAETKRRLQNKMRGKELQIAKLKKKNAELLRRGPAVKTTGEARFSLVASCEEVYL